MDAHLQPCQDVDPGPGPAPEAAAAPAHPGQRGTALGGHRLRLHEPQPGRPRRPRIRLHPVPARRSAQDRGGARVQSGGRPPGRSLAAGVRRLGRRPHPQADPLRGQHAQRRRHRRRQDRSGAALRRLGQHLVGQRARRRGARRRGVRRRRPGGGVRAPLRGGSRAEAPAEPATSRCATAHGSSWACAASSKPTAPPPSPRPSRTSAPCASCPAWPSSG